MINLEQLNSLPTDIRSLICVAVLLDGKDAMDFLSDNPSLERYLPLVNDLTKVAPEIRVPVIGAILRNATFGGSK